MENTAANSKKPLTRFGEFELLKAIAIIGLPTVHVMEEAMEAGIASERLLALGNGIIGLCVGAGAYTIGAVAFLVMLPSLACSGIL